MSEKTIYTCDWCGEIIEAEDPSGIAKLGIDGLHTDYRWINTTRKHFHAGASDDDDSCLLRAVQVLDGLMEMHLRGTLDGAIADLEQAYHQTESTGEQA